VHLVPQQRQPARPVFLVPQGYQPKKITDHPGSEHALLTRFDLL
jgi:hypothetical protein